MFVVPWRTMGHGFLSYSCEHRTFCIFTPSHPFQRPGVRSTWHSSGTSSHWTVLLFSATFYRHTTSFVSWILSWRRIGYPPDDSTTWLCVSSSSGFLLLCSSSLTLRCLPFFGIFLMRPALTRGRSCCTEQLCRGHSIRLFTWILDTLTSTAWRRVTFVLLCLLRYPSLT